MIRPASIVAVALLATGLASCGGSSAPHSTAAQGNPGGGTTPSPGGGTTPSSPAPFGPASPPAPEPHGHLSPAEYEAIKREYTLMQPLTNARDFSRAARRGRAACNALKVPNTTLVHLVQIDCNQALFYFGALDELVNARKR
ncbi:MAG: hypothetical protein QOJ07_1467, partial [Thermoleophilaceae bacterium]|nr:hypothetical protein [Thermoleophilaceae bacterium]